MPPKIKRFPLPEPEHGWSTFVRSRLALTEAVSPRDTTGAAHAQQALDAELSAIHLAMCKVKTRRNALSRISALPNEVLLEIFQFSHAASRPASDASHRLGWITVTHVCRHWRDTALHAPCLWSHISSSGLNYQWTNLMLARTREIPITVCWNLDKSELENYWDLRMLAPHVHRIRRLTLRGSGIELFSFLSSRSFPNAVLETLELHETQCNLDGQHIALELPAMMIGSHHPSLSSVCLTGLCIPWHAPILCDLTHLEICLYLSDGSDTTWFSKSYRDATCDELLCALEKMPALQFLTLKHCLPMKSDRATCVVTLPQLHHLSLCGASKQCFAIFRQLIVPPSCQLSFVVSDDHHPTDFAVFLSSLSAHCTRTRPPQYDTLRIYTSHMEDCVLEAWTPLHAYTSLDLQITLTCPARPETTLLALCDVLPLHAVQTLSVTAASAHAPLFAPAAWRALLAHCPAISEALLTGPDTFTFCAALAPPLGSEPDMQGGPPRAVNTTIAHLWIESADFTGSSEVDGVHRWHRDLVARWLLLRREVAPPARLPPVTLSLVDCVVSLEGAVELEGVASVTWYTGHGDALVESVWGGGNVGGGNGDGQIQEDEGQDEDAEDESESSDDQSDDEDQDDDDDQGSDGDQEDEDLEDEAQDDEIEIVEGGGGHFHEYGTDENQDDRSESGSSTVAVTGADDESYIHVGLDQENNVEDGGYESNSSDEEDDPRLRGGKW